MGAVLMTLLAFGQPILAATEISTDIEGDTTWTKENGPYFITEAVNFSAMEPGATLNIEPGTIVEFSDDARINIFGNLMVNGTEVEPIIFKASEDSTYHNWSALIFDSSQSIISHLRAENADYSFLVFDSDINISSIDLSSADLLFDNATGVVTGLSIEEGSLLSFNTSLSLTTASIVNANSGFGLIADSGTINISDLTINDSAAGINLSGGIVATLADTYVSNSQSGPALYIDGSNVAVSNSGFIGGNSIGIGTSNGSNVTLNNVTVSDYLAPGIGISNSTVSGTGIESSRNLIGISNNGGPVSISHSKVKENEILGIEHGGESSFKISESVISNNGIAGVQGNGTETVDAIGNYWGHPEGPTIDPFNPATIAKGDAVLGNVQYDPWLSEYCEAECHSNIMFLPGIMSSRLYKDGEQLWEPGTLTRDSSFEHLYLDQNGDATDPTIYTKDVLDNGYAYGKLIEDLNLLKSNGTINDYEAVAYDWRLSLAEILSTGTKREDGTIIYGGTSDEPYIESTLRRLAANSKSGKVTIVAHSNGGLVTKALINELGDDAAGLIDQVIFVAVPQLGTPQAIGALLHGYKAGMPEILPFVLSPERARDLATNMPMIYQLMPFADYHNNEDSSVATPYVTFEDGEATQAFIDEYGYAITPDELASFLKGEEGRAPATYEDLAKPINANAELLVEALATQSDIDSSWSAPDGIEVHQIAGIGEDTLAGITYVSIKKCLERNTFFICTRYEDALSYKPNLVTDGDGTVVIPSALAMSESERWWVNLQDVNDPVFGWNREHADILEIDELRDFILTNLLTQSESELENYISTAIPELENENRLVYTLHSPLSLSAIDSSGKFASEQGITIPGASYQRYGEVQVVTIPTGIGFTLLLTGESEGSFTLEMEEYAQDEIITTSTLSAIPSSTSTVASITYFNGSLEDMSELRVDYNGDSIIDLTYTPIINSEVFLPDVVTSPRVRSNSHNGSSGKKGQVLGSSTELTDTLRQLQDLLTNLNSLKSKIPQQQYIDIQNRAQQILHTLLVHLKQNKVI